MTTAYAPVLADVVPTCEDLLLHPAIAEHFVGRVRAGEADTIHQSSVCHPDTGELVGLVDINVTIHDARAFPFLLRVQTVTLTFTPRYAHACVRTYAQ
jgi:hypothetical protein